MKKSFYIILLWGFILPFQSFWATRELSCEEITQLLTKNQTKSYKVYDNNGVLEVSWSDENKWTIRLDIWGIGDSSLCLYKWKLNKPDISLDSKFDTSLATNTEQLIINWQGELKYYASRLYTRSLFMEDLTILNSAINDKKLSEIKSIDSISWINSTIKNLDEFNKSIEEAKRVLEQKSQSGTIVTPTSPTSSDTKRLSVVWQRKAALLKKKIEQLEKQLAQLRKQLDEIK